MKKLDDFKFRKSKREQLKLDDHDSALVAVAKAAVEAALANAHCRIAVVKRLHTLTGGYRMQGRRAARKRPFEGICEASGLALDRAHAQLDELEPEKGYAGRVRWVCPRANNSGTFSCGGCH